LGGRLAAAQVEDVLAREIGQKLAHRRRNRVDLASGPMGLLPRFQIVIGRLHQASSEKPPSTISVWPRTISASGEHRKQTASAMSRGSTSRPAGVRLSDHEIISSRLGK